MTDRASESRPVLLVDADAACAAALARRLRDEGLEVRDFRAAEEALADLETGAVPGLVVTSLRLPGLDGLRFCQLLRSAGLATVPVLVISSGLSAGAAPPLTALLGPGVHLASASDPAILVDRARALLHGGPDEAARRVLIADSSAPRAALLASAFSQQGYRVEVATTAAEAVGAAGRGPLEIAILADRPPAHPAGELLELLRRERPDCLCVVTSSESSLETTGHWLRRGAAASLREPFEPGLLLERCAEARHGRALLLLDELLAERSRDPGASGEKYRQLVEHQNDVVIHFELDWRVRFVNRAYCATFGTTEAAIVGQDLFGLVSVEDAERVTSALEKVLRQPLATEHEERALTVSGWRWFSWSSRAVLSPEGAVESIVAVGRDVTDRRAAEEALRASEERFRRLFEAAPVGIFRTASAGRALSINSTMARILGFDTPQEALEHYPDLAADLYVRPERREELVARLRRDGRVEDFEYEARTRDGGQVWLSMNARRVPGEEDGSFVIEGFTTDVSERKEAQQALHESEARYRTVVENAHDIIFTVDRDFRILMINRPPAGMTAEQAVGTDALSYVEEEHRATVRDQISRVFATGEPGHYEARARGPHDTVAVYETNLSPLWNEGRVDRVVLVTRDVTERRRFEDSLRASEQNLRTLFDAIDESVCLFDRSGKLLATNATFAARLGRSVEDCVGESVYDLLPAEVAESRRRLAEQVIESRRSATFEDERAGRRFRHGIWPVLGAEGEVDRFVIHAMDVTDARAAEAERERLQAQLAQAQKMESVGRLAGGVAHDFNNMLGVILGHAELAMSSLGPGEPTYPDLVEIQKAAERSAQLTRQLLAFARKQTVAPTVLDLNESVSGTLAMLKRLIGEGIDLVWSPGAGLWPVVIDRHQIDQVLANLCINASDAVAGTGRITIETTNLEVGAEHPARPAGVAPGEFTALAVGDDGGGMDSETLAHVFEPFFTTKPVGRGTGLGLATVFGIARQNDGFVDVRSEPGRGSTFTLYLPRHAGEPPADAVDERGTAQGGGETVLLVEDEGALLRLGKKMLESLGYRVLAARSAQVAMELAARPTEEIRLLITDVVMPEMNGRELADRLLALHPELRCLFTSGYTADLIAHHGVLDEGVQFVQKPFSLQELAARAREALGAAGPARPGRSA